MMPNNSERDVNRETISEVVNLIIPDLFEETVLKYNLDYRYQRHEKLRKQCEKQFEKYGISELFDSADFTGFSLIYPENYDEKKLFETLMFALFLKVFDDFLAGDCGRIELETCDNDKQQQQRVKANKPSMWAVIKILAISAFPMIRRKKTIYQHWLLARGAFMFFKEQTSRKLFRRNSTFDCYEKYVKHRRNDFASDMILVGVQNSCGVSFDKNILKHKLMKSLHQTYMDLQWQSNDLFSFKKEFVGGEYEMNAITVLRTEHSVSWQTAVDMLADIVRNTYRQLINCIALINESELNIPDFYLNFLKETVELLGYCIKISRRFQI